jgi:low temperature requirement protein LtrA
VVDFGGPAVFGAAGWRLVPGHFAERHNLVVILALGESVVTLGVVAEADLTAAVITAVVLGIGLASAFWWTYFDVVALITAHRLATAAEGHERNRLARDSYSYLHFPMVAGIVLTALGVHEVLAHHEEPLDAVHRMALLGGTALYLLAHVALRLRNAHSVNVQRLLFAAVLLALVPVDVGASGLVVLAVLVVLLWALIAYETSGYGDSRWNLRHGIAPGAAP